MKTIMSPRLNPDQIIEQFIHSCSHDLRSPIASINGLVKLAEYYPKVDEVNKCFKLIEKCTDNMDKLLRSLEEFMIIHHYVVKPVSIDGQTFVHDLCRLYTEALKKNSIEVSTELMTSKPMTTDSLILLLIGKHLLSNAIAFHNPLRQSKRIRITIEAQREHHLIEIEDNGIGIPSGSIHKVRYPFVKASLKSKGVGMGLFLAHNLVKKIQGEMEIHSIESEGTTIRIKLPQLN